MVPEKKLALFEKYDFSKTRLLKKAAIDRDDPKIELYHDIAGIVQALVIELNAVADGTVQDVKVYGELQDKIYKCYGWLQLKYQGITWREMDGDDPELSVFFKMKKLIDDLGHSVNSFLDKSRISMGNRTGSQEYKNIEKQIKEIGKLMQKYRKTKEKLKEQVVFEASNKTS